LTMKPIVTLIEVEKVLGCLLVADLKTDWSWKSEFVHFGIFPRCVYIA